MAKKGNNKKKGEEEENSDGKKSKFKKINEKAKKSKRKKVKVYLPVLYQPKANNSTEADYKQMPDEEPQMSEYEISYKDALLVVEIEKYAAKGLTNDQIIDAIGISRDTFYRRLAEEPYFSYALHRHRGIARYNVENALYKNAVGFEYTEEQATAMGLVVSVKKQKLAETRAQEIYLYNRDKDQWRKKVEPTVQKGKSISHIGVTIKRRG